MLDLLSVPFLPISSILPFFQVALSLSFLIVLVVVARLYRGIRILNARMDILSALVRNMRKEQEMTAGIDEVVFAEFDAVDARLQSQLKGDFSMRKSPSQEMVSKFSGRSLVRSSIDLDALEARPLTNGEAPPKGKELESYEAKESGLQVDIKSDFSYIGTPQDGASSEPIPALPKELDAPAAPDAEESTKKEAEKEA